MVSSASGESRERPNFSAPQDIVGEYRVAAIDGEGLDQPYGNALSITASEISFEPKCAGSVWTKEYSADGSPSTTRHPDYGGEIGPDGSTVVCAVGLRPTDLPLGRAIDAAQRAGRTPTHAIERSGEGCIVTLISQ